MTLQYQGVVSNWDAERGLWHIIDTTRPGVQAWTPNTERLYDVETAFAAPGPDDEDGPYHDSGDEHKPHA